MKKAILTLLLLVTRIAMYGQGYTYLGTFNSLGVPNYLTTSDIIPQGLLTNVAASLPENYPVPTYNPSYIATGTNSNIVMKGNGHVWVTFVDEGAGYKNVLGYYSYPSNTPPTSIPSNTNLKIIFPNVSKLNSGGGLQAGHKVYLGYFTAGTTISWFLIADGFRNGAVTNGNWRLFSNPAFNPETNPALRYHNVLLYDTTYKKVILGFEDIRRDYGSCDNDFNDAIFYVSATPDTAILTEGMNMTTNPTPNISTGNNGGLESNGSLSELIANRYFKQQKTPSLENLQAQKIFTASNQTKDRGTLNQFIPDISSMGLIGYISTPSDLVGVTNALEIASMDYYDSNSVRQAVLLLTRTENKVYNHTKSICDRLKNASITGITQKEIAGITLITYTLLQHDGEHEYVTCFSLSNHNSQYKIHNQWLISQYPQMDEYYNFQVWSAVPHINQYVVEKILEKIGQIKSYTVDTSAKQIPAQYFKNGSIDENEIHFTIVNNSESMEAEIRFSYTETEKDQRRTTSYPITMTPNSTQSVSVPFNNLFDADIQLVINNIPVDEMYLADGAWGTEYPSQSTQINEFSVEPNTITKAEGVLNVPRSASLNATVSEYITLYKMLKPSNMPMDVSNYEYVNMTIAGNGSISVRLNRKSIKEWFKQGKIIMNTTDTFTSVSIPLSQFKDESGSAIATEDLVSISFTSIAPKGNNTSLQVKNLSFSKEPQHTILSKSGEFMVYPNPATKTQPLQVQYYTEDAEVGTLELIAVNGLRVMSMPVSAEIGANAVQIKIPDHLQKGMYLLQLKLPSGTHRTKLFVD